jgi:hypothetical protein
MIFLSYAEEDSPSALSIADWFRRHDIPVYYGGDSSQLGARFVDQIERQLSEADAFLALDSPHFSTSPWCHREVQLAILREEELRRSRPDAEFIRVLRIADTPRRSFNVLDAYDTFDLTGPGPLGDQLSLVAASLGKVESWAASSRHGETIALATPKFHSRVDELDRVLRGVTDSAGPHFWLVIAPPQLGKTWFLDQLAVLLGAEQANWSARRVDIRDYPDEDSRANVPWLLGHLFGLDTPPPSVAEPTLRQIARQILARRRHHLCLLDSAELLTAETALSLRLAVSEIYRMVVEGDRQDVRVAFVAATRRDDEWRRAGGRPRLSLLPLSEFKPAVVAAALVDLAAQMGRSPGSAAIEAYADLVYRMSEGLPALLARCLLWIEREEWVGMSRLGDQDEFEELAGNYLDEVLLGSANLFRTSRPPDEQVRLTVVAALRGLAPYRLFTLAHLRHLVEGDAPLAAMLTDLGWSVEKLWGEINATALLRRPLDEPWQELQGAIRRLLFRYFYPTDSDRAAAHARARRFVAVWSDGLTGGDQVTGLVECLWHEAAELRYRRADNAAAVLRQSAAALVGSLRSSTVYTESELRMLGAQRMRNNDEFQDTVAYIPGLFDELVAIVDVPDGLI